MRAPFSLLVLAFSSAAALGACNKDDSSNYVPQDTRSCEGMCGHGTMCVKDTCVINWGSGVCLDPQETICDGPAKHAWSECPFTPNALPAFKAVYDRKIPRFDPKKTRTQKFSSGTDHLDEYDLKLQIETVMHELESCLGVAACYHGGDPGPGEVEFAFRLLPSGKVAGVNASATGAYKKWGADKCARKVIYNHEFDAFDGVARGIEYTMVLE